MDAMQDLTVRAGLLLLAFLLVVFLLLLCCLVAWRLVLRFTPPPRQRVVYGSYEQDAELRAIYDRQEESS